MLGGTAQIVARSTPHAGGYDAYADLVRRGAGLTDIAPLLACFAAVLFTAGIWRLRRSITG